MESRQVAVIDSRRTANEVKGVAGSNPAVPIYQNSMAHKRVGACELLCQPAGGVVRYRGVKIATNQRLLTANVTCAMRRSTWSVAERVVFRYSSVPLTLRRAAS
jgi:hypothetical protein